ncbi:MAG: VOC family protein [Lentisphaerae bacterium]|nr:VOC family protein [Lentisphaerota bacterium]
MIKGLAHVCIGATDLQATARFYAEAVQMRRVFDFTRGGRTVGCYLAFPDGGFIEVFQNEALDREARAPIQHICLETDNLDETVARLRKLGCEVSDKRMGQDRSWQAWTSDPSGVRIEFHEYTAESSQRTGAECRLD